MNVPPSDEVRNARAARLAAKMPQFTLEQARVFVDQIIIDEQRPEHRARRPDSPDGPV